VDSNSIWLTRSLWLLCSGSNLAPATWIAWTVHPPISLCHRSVSPMRHVRGEEQQASLCLVEARRGGGVRFTISEYEIDVGFLPYAWFWVGNPFIPVCILHRMLGLGGVAESSGWWELQGLPAHLVRSPQTLEVAGFWLFQEISSLSLTAER
jgi:hypothetical protein